MNQATIDNALDWEFNLSSGNNYLLGDPFANELDELNTAINSGGGVESTVSKIFHSTTGKIVVVGVLTLFFLKVIGEKS